MDKAVGMGVKGVAKTSQPIRIPCSRVQIYATFLGYWELTHLHSFRINLLQCALALQQHWWMAFKMWNGLVVVHMNLIWIDMPPPEWPSISRAFWSKPWNTFGRRRMATNSKLDGWPWRESRVILATCFWLPRRTLASGTISFYIQFNHDFMSR